MKTYKTSSELMNAIDNMDIREMDYDIITKLMMSTSNEMFSKILEEVIDGNLYWSDFDEILSNTDYADILRSNISTQESLKQHIWKLSNFRQKLNFPPLDYEHNNIAVAVHDENTKNIADNMRSEILLKLSEIKNTDSPIVVACKMKLFNALRNGKLLSDGAIYNEKYDYIDPQDIMLFINEYIIPIQTGSQVLNEFDQAYMIEHDISEEMMKKMKSLSILLGR